MGSAALCSYPLEAASALYPLVIRCSWLLRVGFPCKVAGFHGPVRPSCSNSVDKEDLTPVRLAGAGSLCPDLVVVPAWLESHWVVKYTMMSSGVQVCSVLPVLVLWSQSASSLAFLCRCCRVLGATDCCCRELAWLRPSTYVAWQVAASMGVVVRAVCWVEHISA